MTDGWRTGRTGLAVSENRGSLRLVLPQKLVQILRLHPLDGSLRFALVLPIIGLNAPLRFSPVLLDEPLKALGEFRIPVKLQREVTAHIKVTVKGEEAAAE